MKTWAVLLELSVNRRIKIVIKFNDAGKWGDEFDSVIKYFFNEGQCVTNWLPVEAIYFGGNNDSHGLFEYVAHAEWPSEAERDNDKFEAFTWESIFPQLLEN